MSRDLNFSTRGIAPDERLKAWQEFASRRLFDVEVKVRRPEDFKCEARWSQVGSMAVGTSRIGEQEVVRPRPRSGTIGNFAFVFPLGGHFETLQRSRLISLRPGQAYCVHPEEGYTTAISGDASNVIVSLPLQRLRDRVDGIEDCVGRDDFGSSEIVPLLVSLGKSLSSLNTNESESDKLQEVCLDLLTLMVELSQKSFGGDLVPWSMRRALHTNLRLFIKQNWSNTDLTARDAAKQFGVSERYIQKMMSELGTSFQEAVFDHRLEEARRLLTKQDAAKPLRISQVAYQCGFVNQAHFATRYRKRFGVSPRDDRMAPSTK